MLEGGKLDVIPGGMYDASDAKQAAGGCWGGLRIWWLVCCTVTALRCVLVPQHTRLLHCVACKGT